MFCSTVFTGNNTIIHKLNSFPISASGAAVNVLNRDTFNKLMVNYYEQNQLELEDL